MIIMIVDTLITHLNLLHFNKWQTPRFIYIFHTLHYNVVMPNFPL